MNNTPQTSAQELWQRQPVEGTRMSIDEIRKRATKFEKRIFWRNTREYIASAIAIAVLGYSLAHARDSLARWSLILLIAGLCCAMVHLYRKGSAYAASSREGAQCGDFFLHELERQRDLISNLWWYLGPLAPGLVLGAVGSAMAHPQPRALLVQAIGHVFIIGFFGFVIWLNRRAARCLQRQIDELRATEES